MRKIFILVCIFSLFLSLSCSKKSESNKTSNEIESNTSEELNNTNNETNENDFESEDESMAGFFLDEDSESSSKSQVTKTSKSKQGKSAVKKDEPPKQTDFTPPAPVTNLKGYYNGGKNEIVISWTEPKDSDYSHVDILLERTKQGSAKKGTTSFSVKADSLGDYYIKVVPFDNAGNQGDPAYVQVIAQFFNSIDIPKTGVAGKGNTVIAKVKGSHFKTGGVSAEDYKVTCENNPSLAKNAVLEIADDNNINIIMSIPGTPSENVITLTCGNNVIKGTLKVISVPSTGAIEKTSDGKPAAVVAGYNSLGLPFGIALDEAKNQKWATAYGYDAKFTDIECIPSVLGNGSALKATFTGDIDGEDNWDAICKEDSNASNNATMKEQYPLFYYAHNYGRNFTGKYSEGWFIPSLPELCQIYKNRKTINEAMELVGGTPLSQELFYWSSSQSDEIGYNACAVRFSNGSIHKFKSKSDAFTARCIRMLD